MIQITQVNSNEEACRLTSEFMSPNRVESYKSAIGAPIVMGKSHGVRMWDLDGNSFIDCRSAGGIFNFGHRPQFMVDALKQALDKFDMGDWMLLSAQRAQAAEALAQILPEGLCYTHFAVTGSEAVECACKLARGVTGRKKILAMDGCYHGYLGFSLAMVDEKMSHWYAPLVPGVSKIPFGDIKAVEKEVDDDTAAVILETIQGNSGATIPPDGYLAAVRRICDERGALLIFDEVQAGLGRCGTTFAFEHWGVEPDLLVLAKGLGGGVYPVSACCFGDRCEAFFEKTPHLHVSTFMGSELGMAVVIETVKKLTEPGFLDHVNAMAERFRPGLEALCQKYPEILTGFRQKGLFMGLETLSVEQGNKLKHTAIANGILAATAAFNHAVLQVYPPLIIFPDEVDEVLTGLDTALEAINEYP